MLTIGDLIAVISLCLTSLVLAIRLVRIAIRPKKNNRPSLGN